MSSESSRPCSSTRRSLRARFQRGAVALLRSWGSAASLAVSAVKSGDRFSDRLAISLLLARASLFPLGLLRRFGIAIPDPARLIHAYTCRSEGLIVRCPGGGGAHFLLFDPRHDPGVRAAVDALASGTFIDVGAHVGLFSLRAGQRLGDRGRVLAIEPHPVRRMFLQQNVAANRLRNITCLPYAIGDRNGVVTLYDLDPYLGRHSRDVSLAPSLGPSFEVSVRSLDSLCEELNTESVGLVKIDVEGFEPLVLAGMEGVIDRWHPTIVFEALTDSTFQESSVVLERHGYSVRQVDATNFLAESRLTN